jgi:2-methylcitrate dehydratase PrpD
VLPAVLALAEQRDIGGARLLASVALGCDITVRLGRSTGDALAERGWYPPPILGGLGATAACAFLIGLNTRQVLDALSLALHQITASGEIKHSPASIIRGVRDGFAAQAAVQSVQLAERGVRGFDRPLDGASGFFATFAGGEYDQDAVLDDLGRRWAGVQTSFKPWPSCRGTHAFVQAALEARTRTAVDEILEVTLVGAPVNEMLAVPLVAKRRPTSAIDAKFSLPFTVATALVRGGVTLESFSPASLQSADVLRIADRIRFVSDRSGRLAMTAGRMSIRRSSGQTIELQVERPRGNPDDPIPLPELREKFVSCAAHAATPFTRERAETVADDILAVGVAPRVRELIGSWLSAA